MSLSAHAPWLDDPHPGHVAYQLAALGLLLMLLAGCVPQTPTSTSKSHTRVQANDRAPSNKPSHWIGRWVGSRHSQLFLMPGTRGDYDITLRSSQGHHWQHTGNVSGRRLYFRRRGRTFAIAPKPDDVSRGGPRNCLIMQPGNRQFCRRPQSVDALPLAPGTYVNGRQQCHQASADKLLFFTGKQFKRIGRSDCRVAIFDQQGSLFHARVQCGRTSGGAVHQSMHIPDFQHMALTSPEGVTRLYRRCESHRLPPALRTQLKRQDL